VLCQNPAPTSDVAGGAALLRNIADQDDSQRICCAYAIWATRQKHRELGVRKAARFSPKKMAQQYLTLYGKLGFGA
jgi:hypothetical protein